VKGRASRLGALSPPSKRQKKWGVMLSHHSPLAGGKPRVLFPAERIQALDALTNPIALRLLPTRLTNLSLGFGTHWLALALGLGLGLRRALVCRGNGNAELLAQCRYRYLLDWQRLNCWGSRCCLVVWACLLSCHRYLLWWLGARLQHSIHYHYAQRVYSTPILPYDERTGVQEC
jgi:hypothetical protein